MLEQPGFSRAIDPQAVAAYLAFNSIPAPLTIFSEARKLQPGFLLAWRGRHDRRRPATRVLPRHRRAGAEGAGAGPGGGAARGAARTRSAPTWSPTSRSACCSPAASTPAASRRSRPAESVEPVKTFSIGFEESGFDELARARLVAERFGTDHRELILRPDAVELLPKLVESFDEPFGDSSALPTYLVSELAAREVKVASVGRGRRRALRRLLHLRRRPAGAAARSPARRSPRR